MYLFLMIYSVFNLNVVSWGTREVPKKKTAEEMEEDRRMAEEEAKAPPKPSKWAWLTGNSNKLAFWKMFGGNDGLSAQIRDVVAVLSSKDL